MSAPIAPERIIVMAPYLRGGGGHHMPMCVGIAEAARRRGLAADIVLQKNGADPALIARLGAFDLLPPLGIPWTLPGNPPRPDYRLSFRLGALFAERAKALDAIIDDRPTLIVVDGLQPATFLGLAAWLHERHPTRAIGVLHMAIAFNLVDVATGKPSSHSEVYAALLSSAVHARAEIAVFGRRYHREFEALTGQCAAYYPMPMDLRVIPRATPSGASGAKHPLTIVVNTAFAGSVDAALVCVRDRFVRRHFTPRIKLASWGTITDADMQRLEDAGAPLVGRNISLDDYADLFRTQGVLALAYSAAQYRHSTSGVMTEAAAAGLVTVVPGDTWMADCIDEELAAGVTFDALTGRELVRALKSVHRQWRRLNELATRRTDNMRAGHAAEPFVDQAVASFAHIIGRARVYGLRAGQRLGFERGKGGQHLCDGWSFVEQWGRWSAGEVATLQLYVTSADGSLRHAAPHRLFVEARGLAPAGAPQIVDVRCNGIPAGVCRFDSGVHAQTFELPLPPDARTPDMHLEFHVRHPVRPVDLGMSDDPRRLGFGLIGLRVDERE